MRRLVLAACLGFASVPVHAAEMLLVPSLPGWTVIDNRADPDIETSGLIPSDETADGWTRHLVVQAYRSSPMDVPTFLNGLSPRTDEACDGIAAGPVDLRTVNGVETGRRTIACGRYHGDGKGLYTAFLAIRGKMALYVLARSWRGRPFKAGTDMPVPVTERDDWNAFFDMVRLCEDSDCPK